MSIRAACLIVTALGGITSACVAQTQPASRPQPVDWREQEKGILANQVQLTFPGRFVKAGESYFSPDDSKIIFQAVATPPPEEAEEPFYGMFVADVARSAAGRITGIEHIRRISPLGSANTCGGPKLYRYTDLADMGAGQPPEQMS